MPDLPVSAAICALLLAPANAALAQPAVSIGVDFRASQMGADSPFAPPDTTGAVGPSHYVETLNGRYSVYRTSDGLRVQTDTLDGFWAAAGAPHTGAFSFDPRVQYDPASGRWFACSVDNGRVANNFLVAVSIASDPTLGWVGHVIDTDANNSHWADFPMLAVTADAVVITANKFPLGAGGVTSNVLVIPKADLIAGNIANRTHLQDVDPGATGLSAHPVRVLDGGPYRALLSSSGVGSGELKITKLTGPVSAPVLDTTGGFVSVEPRFLPMDALQPVLADLIDTGDTRFSAPPVYRGGFIWAVHCTNRDFFSTLVWYKIDAATATVVQTGEILGGAGRHLCYPSIMVNEFTEIVIGCSLVGTEDFASAAAVVGQDQGAEVVFGAPLVLKAGEGPYVHYDTNGRNRWGDYSAVTIDPSDGHVFWVHQEYAAPGNQWATRVTQLTLSSCGDIDFNNDGVWPDTQDLTDYLSVFSGGSCSTGFCDSVDVNHDGVFPDLVDLWLLVDLFSGRPC